MYLEHRDTLRYLWQIHISMAPGGHTNQTQTVYCVLRPIVALTSRRQQLISWIVAIAMATLSKMGGRHKS